mgnify:CR=1 FL=1
MVGIQVTSGQQKIVDLKDWQDILQKKNIKTFIVKSSTMQYELWREPIPTDMEKRLPDMQPLKMMSCNSKNIVYPKKNGEHE